MRFLALPLAILAVVFGLFLAPTLAERWRQDNQHAQALQLLDEQRQQYALQQWQTQQAAQLPIDIAAHYGAFILLAVAAAAKGDTVLLVIGLIGYGISFLIR